MRPDWLRIEYGHFPWTLLYLPLVVASVAGAAYVTFTDRWDDPIPAGMYWFAAAFTAWWAFLIIRSGVVPSGGPGPATYREDSPFVFWFVVAVQVLMSLLFIVFATDA